jgi:hypothetical protein
MMMVVMFAAAVPVTPDRRQALHWLLQLYESLNNHCQRWAGRQTPMIMAVVGQSYRKAIRCDSYSSSPVMPL